MSLDELLRVLKGYCEERAAIQEQMRRLRDRAMMVEGAVGVLEVILEQAGSAEDTKPVEESDHEPLDACTP